MSEKNWKAQLFRTGLPFEHVVAENLAQFGFSILGEYPYIRPNEHRIETEFSVDLRTCQPLQDQNGSVWGDLNLLVECKYVHRGVRWVFLPYPNINAYPIGVITVLQELCTRQIDERKIFDFEDQVAYCSRGVELRSNNANPKVIRRGLYQLRYACPVLVSKEIRSHICARDSWLSLSLVCPMLITTASLHLLKRDASLEDLEGASELSDVSDEVGALIFNQQPGPQLEDFAQSIYVGVLNDYPEIERRLDILAPALHGSVWENRAKPDVAWLGRTVVSSAERVLIVNYDHLDNILEEIKVHIHEAVHTLTCYGRIRHDDGVEVLEAAPST